MKLPLYIIAISFAVHAWAGIQPAPVPATTPAPSSAVHLPTITVESADVIRTALRADLAAADVDEDTECTFLCNGSPVAVWVNGTITILP